MFTSTSHNAMPRRLAALFCIVFYMIYAVSPLAYSVKAGTEESGVQVLGGQESQASTPGILLLSFFFNDFVNSDYGPDAALGAGIRNQDDADYILGKKRRVAVSGKKLLEKFDTVTAAFPDRDDPKSGSRSFFFSPKVHPHDGYDRNNSGLSPPLV